MTPPVVQQVTFLYSRDLGRSVGFYRDDLGLAPVLDQGACRIFRVAGDAFLGVCSAGKREPRPGGVILTLISPDVDAWHARLEARGVTLEGPPRRNERFNIYNFFARDPDGYLVEIQRFLDPAWPAPLAAATSG